MNRNMKKKKKRKQEETVWNMMKKGKHLFVCDQTLLFKLWSVWADVPWASKSVFTHPYLCAFDQRVPLSSWSTFTVFPTCWLWSFRLCVWKLLDQWPWVGRSGQPMCWKTMEVSCCLSLSLSHSMPVVEASHSISRRKSLVPSWEEWCPENSPPHSRSHGVINPGPSPS